MSKRRKFMEDLEESGLVEDVIDHPKVQELVVKAQGVLDQFNDLIAKVAKGEIPIKPVEVAQAARPKISARQVLHFGEKEELTEEKVRKRRQELARMAHPDLNGDGAEMARINKAAELLLKSLKKK